MWDEEAETFIEGSDNIWLAVYKRAKTEAERG